jgi:hypothetical protein
MIRLNAAGEMQVRLAHEQGLLSHPSLNPIQRWALSYWVGMKQAELELSLLGSPTVSVQVDDQGSGDRGQAFGGQPELPITDPDDLDRWFDGLTAQRGMSGGDLAALGWVDGLGVKV